MNRKPSGLVVAILLIAHVAPGDVAGGSPRDSRVVVMRSAPAGDAGSGLFRMRTRADKWGEALRVAEGETHELRVKFLDEARARLGPSAEQLLVSMPGADALDEMAKRHRISFRPLLRLPEAALRDLEQRAASRSGIAQPDYAGIMIADIPDRGAGNTLKVARALRDSDLVEYVEIVITSRPPPPPGDIPPATPDLSGNQTYRPPDPGLDIDYAWSLGFKGAGIRLTDCEYGVNTNHEDLLDNSIALEPGQTIHASVFAGDFDEHGTAVLGILGATENGYGMDGLVPEADLNFYSEWTVERGVARETAIANAAADSAAGDVVLLEMQVTGAQGGFGPAEYALTVWNLVKTATDAGILVVAAAGNGAENLDATAYSNYTARGDSGAILVGAGTANTLHNKTAASTYGTRVNVQGWGASVDTLGYGFFAEYGGDTNQRYTATFSGTSAAAAFVAGACVAVQNYCEQTFGFRLTPQRMRQLLVDTGIPQGTGGHIGPFPDVRAALETDDIEGDGLPDAWELQYQASLLTMNAASDSDGDGQTDLDEWIALTVPTNGSSSFSFQEISNTAIGSGRILEWAGASGRLYRVWWKASVTGQFANVASNLPATLPVNSYTDTVHAGENQGFYGIGVRMGP